MIYNLILLANYYLRDTAQGYYIPSDASQNNWSTTLLKIHTSRISSLFHNFGFGSLLSFNIGKKVL